MPNYPPASPFEDQLLKRQRPKGIASMPGMGGGGPKSTTEPVPGQPPNPLDLTPPAPPAPDGRPPGFTGDWPPKLPPGSHRGHIPGQIVYDIPGEMPGGKVPGQADPPPPNSPPGTPGTGGTYSPGGPGGVPTVDKPPVDSTKYGGGWNEPHGQDPAALALKQAFAKGLTGQAAVDWVNANTPYNGAIAFYADKNTYGAPNWYAAPNGASGALDLIKRSPEGPSTGGKTGPTAFTPGTSYKPNDVTGLRQYAPSGAWGGQPMYTDDKGHFFIPDPANIGQGIYVGENPNDAKKFTQPQPGTNGPDMRGKPVPNPNAPPPPGGPSVAGPGPTPSPTPGPTSGPLPLSYGALPTSTTPAPDVPPPPTPGKAVDYTPPTTAPSPTAPTTAPALAGRPSTSASSLTSGGTPIQGQAGSFFDALMKRANQSLAPDANDPTIKNQVDAFRAQQVRGERDTLTQLAEQGGPSANLDTQKRMLGEAAGQNTSTFEAGLRQNEITARRQEIQQALNSAQGLLTNEQQMQLQEELASLTNAERQFEFTQGQEQSAQQFGASLKQRGHEFDTSTATQQGQFSAQQKEQARQFDAQYGQGAWEFTQSLKARQYESEQGRALSQSQFGYGQRQQAAQFAAKMGYDYASLSLQDKQFMDNLMQRAFEFDTNDQFRKSPLAG